MIDSAKIAEWKALADSATPGPWTRDTKRTVFFREGEPCEGCARGLPVLEEGTGQIPVDRLGMQTVPARWHRHDFAPTPSDTAICDAQGRPLLLATFSDSDGMFEREEDAAFARAAREAVPALIAEVERLSEMAGSADRVLAWCLRRDPLASPAAGWRLRYAALTGRASPERHYAPDEREELVPRAEAEALRSLLREVDGVLRVIEDGDDVLGPEGVAPLRRRLAALLGGKP